MNQDLQSKNSPPLVPKILSREQNRHFMIQKDNIICHTELYLRWWKDNHNIWGLDYQASQSLDLNLTEHLWWTTEGRMSNAMASTNNICDLKALVQQEWQRIGFELASTLAYIMQHR
ncbi:hypothetical protein PHYBLDRAFT_69519 [Phycomyces blakesleeanus NRRL 1555(-)]|uniref:Tc1-like transposase DDE domain-containing protein n=1 Tax=Phycomyces blakesleeanus (strain ATCC 8743b / DSM 1359 / FGSC 10004 / NBRC 33097 / NRRL 1555) TaxID=763407 RepID=A0A162WS84_PHYB8|nr:hypothetical protein PHYBLDRAFT_69519 [Phycomyces blakesleeanus NRRL 1555(-)]OAD70645.1 hypothetical protein PHYBLDRAFT_69519 [Phycomyces blakesleeanus NRRL 1555(-)]|eukprot:XP_018288685.1 hypothetical protein PHYBLDRAFT_69519 [Phycomyces blakesleeanus NRRL 1555(-)]